jgi:peptidoglycan hydrolase-like protein with peptidoglycan-binding domain
VARGKPLFKIDERPVVALYGPLPFYRPLQIGAVGADVRELQENLAALGFPGVVVDNIYTSSTAAAVRAWQGTLGLPQAGAVDPEEVVFTSGPVRVAQYLARVGDMIGAGSTEGRGAGVLTYTGTSKLVTVDLDLADRSLAIRGRRVTVTVPSTATVAGIISAVGIVATTSQSTSDTSASASSDASDARVRVTVTIANQAALGPLDGAPVDVDLVSGARRNVLAVPVGALLALPDGGFGVEVVDGDTSHTVPVKAGLFASGRVEISGNGISAGMQVGVAK